MAKHFSETRTEDLIKDLLFIQGWSIKRPPKGNLIRQNEYKDFSHLEEIFKGKSKSGGKRDAYPDFLIIDKDTSIPQIVIEAKANKKDFTKALTELTDGHFFFDTIAAYLLNRRGSYVKASNS